MPPRAGPRTRRTLHVRRAVLGPTDVVELDGLPVTSAVRTWFDLARHQALIEAVAAVDWALHHRLVTMSALSAYVEARRSWNGVASSQGLYYPDARLGIEFDGDHHRTTLMEDNRRQNSLLARFGIRLLRFTSSDVYRRPDHLIDEVERTLAQKSALITP